MHWKPKKCVTDLIVGFWDRTLSILQVCLYMSKSQNDGEGQVDILQCVCCICDGV